MQRAFTLRLPLCFGLALTLGACDPKELEPGSTGTGSSSTDTGEPQGCVPPVSGFAACSSDEECAIAGDCCGCVAYTPANSFPADCGGSCEQDKCEQWGITQAVCRQGRCVGMGHSCNADTVSCNGIAPECEEGFLPGVFDQCWTGDCMPIEACDWVPSCDTCSADQVCMHERRSGCDYARCVENLPECAGSEVCACTGAIFCEGGTCAPASDGFSCN